MRKILTLFIFFTAISASASEPGKFSSAIFSPSLIKTGMKCFVRISVSDNLDQSDSGEITIASSKWFHLIDIKVNYDENEILLWFIPLDPSITWLPEIRAGKFVYSGIPVSIESVLTEESTINPSGGMVLLPGTRMLFAFIAAVFILTVFLLYLLFSKLPGRIIKIINSKKKERRRKELLFILKSIAENLSKGPGSGGKKADIDIAGKIVKSLREFLELATEKKITCFTTAEIVDAAANPPAPADELFFLDYLRFSPLSSVSSGIQVVPDEAKLAEAAEKIYSFAVLIDNAADKADGIPKRIKGESGDI
ncbi:MAG: hypothetical protein RBT69_08165 [Spirochaetia bacterium]|nr:hypothetical protein [Spirochaetia bacterium]